MQNYQIHSLMNQNQQQKNGTELLTKLSITLISISNEKASFTLKLLLNIRKVANLCKAFANNLNQLI